MRHPDHPRDGPRLVRRPADHGHHVRLITFPQIFFYGLYTVVGQVLNAKGAFGAYMWAPVLNNIIAIAGLVVFIYQFGPFASTPHTLENWTSAQTFWLVGMSTVGVIAQALILFWPLKRLGLGLRPKFGWRGIGLSTAAKLGGWTWPPASSPTSPSWPSPGPPRSPPALVTWTRPAGSPSRSPVSPPSTRPRSSIHCPTA
ncbi:lipid II flippase MurJ [Kocuria atrinae]|uniref:lipid II flippase MurJ n=1 Tax=Kocuria atrinae TaxID=592377 RepID=UPI0029432DD6|nr:lipid II flippase MurJ [Kocuria atrinae]